MPQDMAHIVLKTELRFTVLLSLTRFTAINTTRDTVLQIHVLGIKSDVMLIY